MPVSPMKRMYVVTYKSYTEEVIRRIQDSHLVQITDIRKGRLKEIQEMQKAPETLDEKLNTLSSTISFLENLGRMRTGFVEGLISARPVVSRKDFERISKSFKWPQICGEIQEIIERIRVIEGEKQNLQTKIAEISRWTPLDMPLSEIRRTDKTESILGIITVKPDEAPAVIEKLRDMYCRIIWQERNQIGVLIVHPLSNKNASSTLRDLGFVAVSLPKEGKPVDILVAAQKRITEIEKEKRCLEERAVRYLPEILNLKIVYDSILIDKERMDIRLNLGKTDYTTIIEGWIRKRDLQKISEILKELPVHFYTKDAEKDEDVPTDLENPSIIKPFEIVVRLYGRPAHFEIDPTPILTAFYFIFFGLCLGDIGYGIALCLFSSFVLWRYKPSGGYNLLFKLFFIGGIGSIIMGFLVGGFFGTGILGAFWFNMNDQPLRFLILALALGITHIFTGIILRMYMNIRNGRYLDAIFDQGLWLIFLSGLIVLGLGTIYQLGNIGKYMALAGAVGLVLTQGRHKKGILRKVLSGVLSLYGVMGYISDTLSYSRLLALGMATGIIAMVFNTIGLMVLGPSPTLLNIFLAVVILFVTHAFNFILGVLGAFVHTSRLQFVEFFNKFYGGGGTPFHPFTRATRYVTVRD